MQKPSIYFNKPIIGKIKTKPINDVFVGTEYNVIDIEIINGKTIYVCDQWYKEHSKAPQLMADTMVEKFIKY